MADAERRSRDEALRMVADVAGGDDRLLGQGAVSHRVDGFFCAVDAGGGGMVDTSSTAIILCEHVIGVVGFWQVTWRLFELAVRWVSRRNLWCRGLFFDHRNMCRIKAPLYPGAM